MKKILAVITTGFVSWGGLTTVMMNYYREIDKKSFKIDFAADNIPNIELLDEINLYKSTYYQLPDRKTDILCYMKSLYKVLKNGKYEVVHIHGNSSTMFFELLVSYIAKINKRIVHVHNTQNMHPFLNKVLNSFMKILMTEAIAVSNEAGIKLYGNNKFLILNNAINCNKYKYDQQKRYIYRKELEIEDNDFLIGTIGKLNIQKNHEFLIKIFQKLIEIRPDARLVIVGDGIKRKNLEDIIENFKLRNKVKLTGTRLDTEGFLSAMDVFVLPSLYEGFCLALIEAQAAGLFCVVSDCAVSGNIELTDNCIALSINSINPWLQQLYHAKKTNRTEISKKAIEQIEQHGYSIKNQIQVLEEIYSK